MASGARLRRSHFLIAGALVIWALWTFTLYTRTGGSKTAVAVPSRSAAFASTVVVYSYANADYARENMYFFFMHGLDSDLSVTYYIILQSQFKKQGCSEPVHTLGPDAAAEFGTLPNLPSNAFYVLHRNECYDLGTYGWLLKCLGSATKHAKYWVFVNSSVRGPFMPSYAGTAHWTRTLTQYLRGHVKLVGSTINCEIMPHVQSYAFATDSLGLQILVKGGALDCHHDHESAVQNGELRLSRLMYNNSLSVTSLMSDQRHVIDWADGAPAYCSTHPENPTVEGRAFRALHPFEVLFVKVKNDIETRGVTYSGQKEALFFSKD